jgi:hypothetical protein
VRPPRSIPSFLQRYEAFPNRNYEDVSVICFLRQLRRQIQRMVQRFRPPTSEELDQMQRWLPWEQVVQVCERLKQRYERGECGSEQRARALMEFLVVAMYVEHQRFTEVIAWDWSGVKGGRRSL